MEKYFDFLDRISYQKAKLQICEGDFTPHKSLFEKVNTDNSFSPFYGDTVVFELDLQTKERIFSMVESLYAAVPECFCEGLNPRTLHMTLHDLDASVFKEKAATLSAQNESSLRALLTTNPVTRQTIKMKTNFVINMIGISLVLALVPDDEKEWNKLQKLYELIDNVKECDYPFLTPHITLAYYNYNGFSLNSVNKLKAAVEKLNGHSFKITLDTDKLFYKRFSDMNNYESVFALKAKL